MTSQQHVTPSDNTDKYRSSTKNDTILAADNDDVMPTNQLTHVTSQLLAQRENKHVPVIDKWRRSQVIPCYYHTSMDPDKQAHRHAGEYVQ